MLDLSLEEKCELENILLERINKVVSDSFKVPENSPKWKSLNRKYGLANLILSKVRNCVPNDIGFPK